MQCNTIRCGIAWILGQVQDDRGKINVPFSHPGLDPGSRLYRSEFNKRIDKFVFQLGPEKILNRGVLSVH